MNAFEKLLALPAAEQKHKGIEHTPREIAQQPAVWQKTASLLAGKLDSVRSFCLKAGVTGRARSVIVLTGAGTSEFIGSALAGALRRTLRRDAISIPTTYLVTHMPSAFVPGHRYTIISFARSGNSPESLATYEFAKRVVPRAFHIVITCNKDGALAKAARKDANALCLVLPKETDDRSLAMTSSFSSMALTGIGLGFLNDIGEYQRLAGRLGSAAQRVISAYGDALAEFAARPFTRACFLGSNTLCGTMQECHLKMQEMTNGRVASRFDSFLGLRHGPQVFVNREAVVVAALASDPFVRRYEFDLLKELRTKKQGCGTLAICDRATPEIRGVADVVLELFPGEEPVHDDYRVMTDVVAGQMLAVFKSLNLGLKPDNPSPGGTINRVVQGVTIYEPPTGK